MNEEEIYQVIDKLREVPYIENEVIKDRLLNYLEANIDEFILCYQESEEVTL